MNIGGVCLLMASDAPNATVPSNVVLVRWSLLTLLLAVAVVYFMMRTIGFSHGDAAFITGLSTVPLGVAIIVAVLVWKFYWRME